MEARPPILIERVVRLLLPPDTREHVLGDLAERYSSPRQYMGEAVRTVPLVVASRIRRTANGVLLFLPAVLFMMALGGGPGDFSWIRGGIPTIAVLLGLALRDAYRIPDAARPWRQGLVDVAVVTGLVLLSQTVLLAVRPDWLVASDASTRYLVTLGLLFLTRVQNPAGGFRPRLSTYAGTISLAGLNREVRSYEEGMRRAIGIELGVGSTVVLVCAGITLFGTATPLPIRIASALTTAGALFVLSRMWARWQMPPIPSGLPFSETLGLYTNRLEAQHRSLLTMWRWYGLPLGIGPTLIFATVAARSANPVLGVIAAVGLFVATGVFFHRVLFARQARSLRQRLDALALMTEER